MSLFSRVSFKSIFSKLSFVMVFVLLAFGLSACDSKTITVSLSNEGQAVVLYLEDGVSTEETVFAYVDGSKGIDKHVSVSSNNALINVEASYEGGNTTSITLSANGVCQNAVVTVTTLEGNKTMSFYVNVEVPVGSIYSTTKTSELYVVRGESKILNASKLVQYSPASTTQKEVEFTLQDEYAEGVNLSNGVLTVGNSFALDQVVVKATSVDKPSLSTFITLDVLEPISSAVEYSAYYTKNANEVDLENTITLTKNIAEGKLVDIVVDVDTTETVSVLPYIKSTAKTESQILEFVSSTKNTFEGKARFVFTLSATEVSGHDEVYFVISYDAYGYKYTSQYFEVETFDAIKSIQLLVDGLVPATNTVVVYHEYYGSKIGLEINTEVAPTAIPQEQKVLVLERQNGAADYTFYKKNAFGFAEEIVFEDDKYEFVSGEPIFVKANDKDKGNGAIRIYAKVNEAISQTLFLDATQGTASLEINGTQIDNNGNKVVYLTSNEVMKANVNFSIDNDEGYSVDILTSGDAFEVDRNTLTRIQQNNYTFQISSIKGKVSADGVLLIRSANGFSASLRVEVFEELTPNEVNLTAPAPQHSAAVGNMQVISSFSNTVSLQFSVAIKQGSSITLGRDVAGATAISYTFADTLLSDYENVYDEDYQSFMTLAIYNNMQNLAFSETSNIIQASYLSGMGEVYGLECGKTCVEANIFGYELSGAVKQPVSLKTYFFVEVYIPIETFSLSKSNLVLYAEETLGASDNEFAIGSSFVNLNSDATYANIDWIAEFGTNYTVGGKTIYNFVFEDNEAKIHAYSTRKSYDDGGEIKYRDEASRTFYFVAKMQEFSKSYALTLKVEIRKAQQVEKIAVLDVNLDQGIYLQLDGSGKDLTRPITAEVRIGESGIEPFNSNLVYEFLPDAHTLRDAIDVNRETGYITVDGSQTTGGAGQIRIAPADRYTANGYEPGEKDVAVYIDITIADGNSRETAYRVQEFTEITDLSKHYVVMSGGQVLSLQNYVFDGVLTGGIYGALIGKTDYVTINIDKPLVKEIGYTGKLEDIIIATNINGLKGAAAVCDVNHGSIKNVTIETFTVSYAYSTIKCTKDTPYVGGITAENYGIIENSSFFGAIASTGNAVVGGIAGLNAGEIKNSKVEIYNYKNSRNQGDFGKISGTTYTGGLVGEMTAGKLENSYIYSYASKNEPAKDFMQLEVLSGGNVGVLVGNLTGGKVDMTYGFVNDIASLTGNNAELSLFGNAYVMYRTDNENVSGLYIQNGAETQTKDLNYTTIWAVDTNKNFGLPYFKGMLQEVALENIADTLANGDNIFSIQGKSVIFHYSTAAALSMQEIFALDDLNFISFEDLFPENANLNGLRATTSNQEVVAVSANGIQITGKGVATITLFSKYDSTISKTFTIYTINPILNFKLLQNGVEFGHNSNLKVKTNANFSFTGIMQNSIILDRNYVLLDENQYSINLQDEISDYVSNKNLSVTLNTIKLYEDLGQDLFAVEFALAVENEVYSQTQLEQINSILGAEYAGTFYLNFYKGADVVDISKTEYTFEPSEEIVVEGFILSDLNETEEGIEVFIDSAEFENAFDIRTEYVSSEYYTSKTDLSQKTDKAEDAVYYKHFYRIYIEVAKNFKNFDFDKNTTINGQKGTEINAFVYASSSFNNQQANGTSLVFEDFVLVVNSQDVTSINANHYALIDKNLVYDNVSKKNIVHHYYSSAATSVLAPGEEGLLKVNLFPDYADYDYLKLAYTTNNGQDALLSLGLMKKEANGVYTRWNNSYEILDNEIRVYNSYTLETSQKDNQNIIYISTFIPLTTAQDVVFNIEISAVRDGEIVKTIPFNLIVQYLEGAEIAVYNTDGKQVDTVARGSTQKLVLTLEKDQTLENLYFSGVDTSISNVGNYITYANQTTENLPSSILKTITYDLYIGETLEILHNANYVTIEAVISWKQNGKQQTKITSMTLGIVDFVIEEISLLTDKLDKTNLTTYVGLDTSLQFDFNGNKNQSSNAAFNSFVQNFYYENRSQLNSYGDYVVNTNNFKAKSFLGNLYYVNGDGSTTSIIANDGSITSNSYFTITLDDETGKIGITGIATTNSPVKLVFKLQVQYPNAESRYYIEEIAFEFTITVVKYSDEDTPLIIENEAGFYDALAGDTPENYILMSDLYLENYTPQNTNAIKSLDGNNFTISIMSYENETATQVENFALFSTVAVDTILKNLTVNIYHATSISVNTSVTRSVNVAGLAITNYGTIYNCEVVAYQANKTSPEIESAGIVVSYSSGNISSTTLSTIAGFVVQNEGNISNSRVGGALLQKVNSADISLPMFNISGQGNIAGFVYDNRGNIASSYFANGQITNNTASGIETRTAGFVGTNGGQIHTSYVKGFGSGEYSLSGGGIVTSSISAGFAYANSGDIGDCYANIMLASSSNNASSPYESGRFTAGFAYVNTGEIERCYTASKIENAKNTQTAFLGVDENNQKQNTGTIKNSYYYASSVLEGDSYTDLDQNVSIKRIQEPDNTEYFYGFAFSNDANSVNGVWYATAYGVELVSANQIAVSNRYLANVSRNPITNEIESYNLPYTAGYEYGSEINPIIIKNADEYNLAFGGYTTLQSSAVEQYRNASTVWGNYRFINNINFAEIPSTQIGKIGSTDKTLRGGIIDGNMFTISGLDLTASADTSVLNYGLFAKLEDKSIIMNMNVDVVLVSAGKAQNVGVVAGSVYDSKLININLDASSQTSLANVTGRNIVGGLAGIVQGDSEVKNITANNISVTAEYKVPSSSQAFSRNNSEIINLNAYVSYAGGIIGVADIYGLGYSNVYTYDQTMKTPHLLFLKTKGAMIISGSTAGGVVGYLGPRTFMKDATLELSSALNQKIVADKFYAGGIVGESYGDLDMLRAEHELTLQNRIESSISAYYHNPASTEVERGNVYLFESTSQNKPLAIGGLVGLMTTGTLSHAYSKVNVVCQYATYAGGIVGQIPGLLNASKYQINFNEVYAFGDVRASSEGKAGAGGIAGYIDFGRKLAFNKVNAVNFWGLVEDTENNTYTIPSNTYSVFALTGSSLLQNYVAPEYIDKIARLDGETVVQNSAYSAYNLPSITCAVGSDDMFAVTTIKFNGKNGTQELSLKKSFARLNTGSFYDMIQDSQSIVPLYELSSTSYNGVTMDQYFLQSDWDPNYWVRYTTELLPKLVMFSDTNLFYIDKAEDLQKIIQYPSATFIVRAAESPACPIVNIGSYLVSSGIDFSSIVFTGVLKGLDNTMNYGFDFNGLAVPFFESTQNAKIYNLTFQNLGALDNTLKPTSTSIVNSAQLTSFENLTLLNCHVNASVSTSYHNVGILANQISGGFVSNVTFINCSVTAVASEDMPEAHPLAVGMLAGEIQTKSSANMQIGDVTAYMSSGFVNPEESILNDIVIDANGHAVENVSAGVIAGKADGAVMLAYTTTSATSQVVKGVGVADTKNPVQNYQPDSAYSGINSGVVIDVQGMGKISNYNAGLLFGETNNLTVSFQRISTASKLKIVGAILADESANIEVANVGGLVGKANISTSLTNGATAGAEAFVVVDVDTALKAGVVNAGGLIGSAVAVEGIDNIESFGTINAESTSGQTNIGGFIGVVNGSLEIMNAISRTGLTYSNNNTNLSDFANVGGMIGLFNTTSNSLRIGDLEYNAKYLGRIVIDGANANVGGIVGGIKGASAVENQYAVEICGAIFGGNILVNGGEALYVGGILGNSNTAGGSELRKTLTQNISYGDIFVAFDMSENDLPSYFGGILGKGSTRTYLNTNYSVCTITSSSSDITENMNINAVVGTSNGSLTENSAKNYYSNQVTLCLDYNESDPSQFDALATENVYYFTNNSENQELPTLAGVIGDYTSSLDYYEQNVEVYEGSKLNPIKVSNASYDGTTIKYGKNNSLATTFDSEFNGKRKYFVLTETLSQDKMKNVNLKNSHFVGDGFSVNVASDAVFANIETNSVVAGVKVVANELKTNTTTVYSKLGTVATGAGALANVNNGTVYACNATEAQGPDKFQVVGLKSDKQGVYTGGLVGVNGGQILDSTTDIDVVSTATSTAAGAFVGFNDGIINNSYTTGSVNSAKAFAFAEGSANGKIYSSYTAAITQNGLAVGEGVFGGNTVRDCYFDLYSTGTYEDKGTSLTTNDMSTMLAVTEDAPKDIFLTNSKATKKFAYDITTNYGYLSFSGEAYKDFPYLKNSNTGDGSEQNAFMIHTAGKLQQINTMNAAKNYKLTNDIAISKDMKDHGDDDYGIKKWRPIGLATGSEFIGTITGAYGTNQQHILTDIAATTFDTNYNGIFGETRNATIKNITVAGEKVSTNAKNVGGLVAIANTTTISNIEIKTAGLASSSTSGANVGGVAGVVKGESTLDTCNVQAGFELSGKAVAMGGVVGKLDGKTTVKACATIGALTISHESGNVSAGAIVGDASSSGDKGSITDCSVGGAVKITTGSSSGSASLGALVGSLSNFTLTDIEFLSASTIEYKASGAANLGGLVGNAIGSEISNVGATSISVKYDTTSSGGAGNLGGLFGNVDSTSIKDITTPTTFTLSYKADSSSGSSALGGLIGSANSATMTNSAGLSLKNEIEITYESDGTAYIGGLVGKTTGVNATGNNFSNITLGNTYSLKYTAESGASGTAYIGAIAGETSSKLSGITAGTSYTIESNANNSYTGSLAGKISGGTVDGCVAGDSYTITASGSSANYLGSFAGEIAGGDVEDLTNGNSHTFNATGSGEGYIGGFAGKISSGEVSNAKTGTGYNYNYKGSSTAYMGGLAGSMSGGTISNGSAVQGSNTFINSDENDNENAKTNYMGGLVGLYSGGSFSSASAYVSGDGAGLSFEYYEGGASYMGGLFGKAEMATSTNLDPSGVALGVKPSFKYNTSKTGTEAGADVAGDSYMGGIVALADGLSLKATSQYEVSIPTFSCNGNGAQYFGGVAGKIMGGSEIAKITVSGFSLTNASAKTPVGAVASIIENSSLSDITVTNASISLEGSGYAGGVAGKVSGASAVTYSNVKVSGSSLTDNAQNKETAIGGLIGMADASGLTLSGCSTDTTTITGFYTAGGLIGKGLFAEIKGCINGATVSVYHNSGYWTDATEPPEGHEGPWISGYTANNEDLKTDGKGKIYAGGIVGFMTGGKITNDTKNMASVCAGAVASFNGKNYTERHSAENFNLAPYAGGIVGYVNAGDISKATNNGAVSAGFKSSNSSFSKIDKYDSLFSMHQSSESGSNITRDIAHGSDESFAAGIAGYVGGGAIGEAVNSGTITADAHKKITFSYHYSTALFGIYEAVCYYGIQEEYAYANGIAQTDSSSIDFSKTTNSGVVNGGRVVEFNMFNSKGVGDIDTTNAFILDYGYNNGSLYNSFAMMNGSAFAGGLKAWKTSNNAGIKMVAANENFAISETEQAVFAYGSDYTPNSQLDVGRPVYCNSSGTNINYLYYYFENEDGDIELRRNQFGDPVDPSDATPVYTRVKGDVGTSDKNLKTVSLANLISNKTPSSRTNEISLLEGLTDSITGTFRVMRNTSDEANALETTLSACQ